MAKTAKKAGAPEKYHEGYPERLKFFFSCPEAITSKGILSPSLIGKLFGVNRETVRRWVNVVPGFEDHHKPDFAAVFNMLQNLIDSGAVKRAMIEKAKGFTQIKITREPKTDGPPIPDVVLMDREKAIAWLKNVLKVGFDENASEEILKMQIIEETRKRIKTKMVITKRETIKHAGSEAAAKMVLSNIEDKQAKDRWDFTEKTDNTHHIDGLSQLMEQIDGSGKRLPGQEEQSGVS